MVTCIKCRVKVVRVMVDMLANLNNFENDDNKCVINNNANYNNANDDDTYNFNDYI